MNASTPVVVITGASSGIGAALGRQLAQEGARLVLVARRAGLLEAVAGDCGEAAVPVAADVTSRASVQRVVRETLARFGQIDVWVNNVGQGISRLPSELSEQDIDTMVRLNVTSALYGMQEVLPHFKARNAGHVINVSSMLGRIPLVMPRSAYSGAKHFLNALTASFRAEIQTTHPGIQISLISPGIVRTEFGLNALHGGPDSRTLPDSQSPDEVAAVIRAVIRSRQADVYTREGAQARVAAYYAAVGVDP
jgi:NADP-dependent 3-hydroxy acid dehydrogenase YdfG